MPAIRKLPSGKWQATVRLPDGKRTTRTSLLRRAVVDWARDLEEQIARGRWDDPNGRITYLQWREKFMATRSVEPETMRGDKAIMATHIAPFFDAMELTDIKPSTASSWLNTMIKDEVGHASQVRAFNLFRSSLRAAVLDELIESNPADRVDPPRQIRKRVEWFTPREISLICSKLGARDRAMALTMAWCGLRWGEAAGLRVGDIDYDRKLISVVQVVTQSSRVKAYPKNSRSRRELPAPSAVLTELESQSAGKHPDDLVFRAVGGPLNGSNWRKAWYAAIDAANESLEDGEQPVPKYSPHALRHTSASWLVQAGVPLTEIQRLLGHSTPTMTNRYAHLAPGAHSAVENAWAAMSREPS